VILHSLRAFEWLRGPNRSTKALAFGVLRERDEVGLGAPLRVVQDVMPVQAGMEARSLSDLSLSRNYLKGIPI